MAEPGLVANVCAKHVFNGDARPRHLQDGARSYAAVRMYFNGQGGAGEAAAHVLKRGFLCKSDSSFLCDAGKEVALKGCLPVLWEGDAVAQVIVVTNPLGKALVCALVAVRPLETDRTT